MAPFIGDDWARDAANNIAGPMLDPDEPSTAESLLRQALEHRLRNQDRFTRSAERKRLTQEAVDSAVAEAMGNDTVLRALGGMRANALLAQPPAALHRLDSRASQYARRVLGRAPMRSDYEGVHTTDNSAIAAAYAMSAWRKDDQRGYPVVLVLNVTGLKALPDIDAMVRAAEVMNESSVRAELRTTLEDAEDPDHVVDAFSHWDHATEAEGGAGDDPAIFVFEDSREPVTAFVEALREADWSDETIMGALRAWANDGKIAPEGMTTLVSQRRYMTDFERDRLVEIRAVQPWWPHVIDEYEEHEGEDRDADAIEAAGWRVWTTDEAYTGAIDEGSTKVVYKGRETGRNREYHGTTSTAAAAAFGIELPSAPFPVREPEERDEEDELTENAKLTWKEVSRELDKIDPHAGTGRAWQGPPDPDELVWTRERVKLADVLELEPYSSRDVEKYSRLAPGTQPPLLLVWEERGYMPYDGAHRAAASRMRGDREVTAFVGRPRKPTRNASHVARVSRPRVEKNAPMEASALQSELLDALTPPADDLDLVRDFEGISGVFFADRDEYPEGVDDMTEEQVSAYAKWLRRTGIAQEIKDDAYNIQPKYFFSNVRKLEPGTWLIHHSDSQFGRFKQGATLEGLHLSRWNKKKTRSTALNTDDEVSPYERVYAFAFEVDHDPCVDRRGQPRRCKTYGPHMMIFQTDAAVSVYHSGDEETQAIFPVGTEYNVHRLRADDDGTWHVEIDGEERTFDTIDEFTSQLTKNAPRAGCVPRPNARDPWKSVRDAEKFSVSGYDWLPTPEKLSATFDTKLDRVLGCGGGGCVVTTDHGTVIKITSDLDEIDFVNAVRAMREDGKLLLGIANFDPPKSMGDNVWAYERDEVTPLDAEHQDIGLDDAAKAAIGLLQEVKFGKKKLTSQLWRVYEKEYRDGLARVGDMYRGIAASLREMLDAGYLVADALESNIGADPIGRPVIFDAQLVATRPVEKRTSRRTS